MTSLRVFSRADVQAAVDMPAAIGAMREAFIRLATGQATVPVRTAISIPPNATTLVMPTYMRGNSDGSGFQSLPGLAEGGLGLKVVSIMPDNPGRGLPLIHALILVLDTTTGEPLAALEGGWLTALRTGAASGLATDLLARPEARTLTVFGAGTQAETQIQAVCAVRPIERVTLCSRSAARAHALAERLAGRDGVTTDFVVASSPVQAVAEADIICTATTSATPVFPGSALRAGTHINAVGAFTTTTRELDTEAIRGARLVVDERAAAEAEAGDLVIPWQTGDAPGPDGWAELGAVAAGMAPSRQSSQEITVFKSVGNAVQDIAVAVVAVARAVERGLGQVVPL